MRRRSSSLVLSAAALALLLGADGRPLSVAKTRKRGGDSSREKKRPNDAVDSARLRKAEMKRRRKQARNLNSLLLPGPQWEVPE